MGLGRGLHGSIAPRRLRFAAPFAVAVDECADDPGNIETANEGAGCRVSPDRNDCRDRRKKNSDEATNEDTEPLCCNVTVDDLLFESLAMARLLLRHGEYAFRRAGQDHLLPLKRLRSRERPAMRLDARFA